MGITDEDYAKALIQKHMQAHLAYLEKQKEEQMRTGVTVDNTNTITSVGTGTVHIAHGGTTTTFTGNGKYTEPMNSYVSEDDLKNEAMEAPLSAIVDMWQMRWGGTWVKETDVADDHFWRIALMRLMGANKLERHNVVSSYSRVYRIIE